MKAKQFVKDHWKEIRIGIVTVATVGTAFGIGLILGRNMKMKGVAKLTDNLFERECQLLYDQCDIILGALNSAQIIEKYHVEEALKRIIK